MREDLSEIYLKDDSSDVNDLIYRMQDEEIDFKAIDNESSEVLSVSN